MLIVTAKVPRRKLALGVAAAALKGAGLAVFDEEHLPELLAYLEKGEGT